MCTGIGFFKTVHHVMLTCNNVQIFREFTVDFDKLPDKLGLFFRVKCKINVLTVHGFECVTSTM